MRLLAVAFWTAVRLQARMRVSPKGNTHEGGQTDRAARIFEEVDRSRTPAQAQGCDDR
jgi:hypothetical protein